MVAFNYSHQLLKGCTVVIVLIIFVDQYLFTDFPIGPAIHKVCVLPMAITSAYMIRSTVMQAEIFAMQINYNWFVFEEYPVLTG
ncbi:hypothetical protein DYU05_00905 [Mucilaginibacter terrenus]|uniref:Uncharacterized protein n=1 Tax=Mucilaginibacter terrenus TaxID=2482727 RepID=A0A3E2NTN6_9SPHI|nr:hypothetical protein DYU05_00905 [Mucilaginibacter terrenus]